MLVLPVDIICGFILPSLSVSDLQALDTAYTNKYLRPQLHEVWKSYQYDFLHIELRENELSWLCRIGVQLIAVAVRELAADPVISKISTLKKLNCAFGVLDRVLLQLASNNPNLEELHVLDICGPNTDNAVSALAKNCRQLHTLRMTGLTDVGIMALASHCHQLRTLNIKTNKVTDAGIQALCDNSLYLENIGLSCCTRLTDEALIAIGKSCPHLLHFCLMENIYGTDDGLISMADKCHKLRSVIICKNNRITSRGLTALWAANPNLMNIEISGNDFISDDDIIQLVQCCPLLQKLNISHCKKVTDVGVIAVAEHCPQLAWFVLAFLDKVSDFAVTALAEHCPQLAILNFNCCYNLTDATLIALGQHCHELIFIDISFLENISDVGIAALAAGCPLLQGFYAADTNITDAGVVALARGCRDLCNVSLNQCRSVGTAAISAIAEHCPLLSRLFMVGCNIDDACLYVIAQHCRNLTFLFMRSNRVSAAFVRVVILSCCKLETMYCFGSCWSEEDRKSVKQCSRRRLPTVILA